MKEVLIWTQYVYVAIVRTVKRYKSIEGGCFEEPFDDDRKMSLTVAP